MDVARTSVHHRHAAVAVPGSVGAERSAGPPSSRTVYATAIYDMIYMHTLYTAYIHMRAVINIIQCVSSVRSSESEIDHGMGDGVSVSRSLSASLRSLPPRSPRAADSGAGRAAALGSDPCTAYT